MPTRDYSRPFIVSTTDALSVKTLNGERVYLLVENFSADAIYLTPDTPGGVNDGIRLDAGQRYERWKPFCPQNDYFITGAVANQRGQITEGYET